MAKGNSEAEFLYDHYSVVLEEVRDEALAREKKKGSGQKATALKMAVDAGASSSSPLPRFDKHHMTKSKAKAKPAAAKAKPAAAKAKAMSEKAIHSKYKAAAAGSSVSGYGTGSDGDCSLDERITSGRALPTPGLKCWPWE